MTWSSGQQRQSLTTDAKLGYTQMDAGSGYPGKASLTPLAFSTRAFTLALVSFDFSVVRSIMEKHFFNTSGEAVSGRFSSTDFILEAISSPESAYPYLFINSIYYSL